MLRLIKLEYSKFRKNNVIVLLFMFFLIFFPAAVFFANLMPDDLPKFVPGKDTFLQFSDSKLNVWDYMGYAGNWIVFFFLGVLLIYTITNEVSYKTLRQSIINGLTRKEFFASKLLNVFFLSVLATLYYVIIVLAIGFWNTEEATMSLAFSNNWAIPRFFLMSLAYLSFALFMSIILRKSGLAVFTYLAYVLIIEQLLRLGAREKIYSGSWVNYFPMNATEDLMPLPWLTYASAVPSEIDFQYLLTHQQAAITTIIFTLIFLGSGYYLFLKKDM